MRLITGQTFINLHCLHNMLKLFVLYDYRLLNLLFKGCDGEKRGGHGHARQMLRRTKGKIRRIRRDSREALC